MNGQIFENIVQKLNNLGIDPTITKSIRMRSRESQMQLTQEIRESLGRPYRGVRVGPLIGAFLRSILLSNGIIAFIEFINKPSELEWISTNAKQRPANQRIVELGETLHREHWFQLDNVVVSYKGDDERVVNTLLEIFGREWETTP